MTDRERRAGFPSECRAFLTRLDEFARDRAPGENLHAEACESCSRLLGEARRSHRLLRRMTVPEVPEEVRSPAFLEQIHERAEVELTKSLGAILQQGLSPVRAPGDVAWLDEIAVSDVERPLREALTRSKSPGWMWKRIRAATSDEAPRPRVALRSAAILTAAALLLTTLLVLRNPFETRMKRGTQPLIAVVFDEQTIPMDLSFSLDGYLEEGR